MSVYKHDNNEELTEDLFEINTKKIILGKHFNKKIKKNVLPETLEFLKFNLRSGNRYKHTLDDVLPNSLTHLNIGEYKNSIGKDKLPASLIHFICGVSKNICAYDKNNDDKEYQIYLPRTIKFLNLTYYREKLEKNTLPQSLLKLYLSCYNHELEEDILPRSLEFLSMDHYNKPLMPNVLPTNLKMLQLKNYKLKINKNVLPHGLTHLELSYHYDHLFGVDVLPKSLKMLSLGIVYDKTMKKNVLPDSLMYIYNLNKFEGKLPLNLKKLYFNYSFNEKIEYEFPPTLDYLYFGRNFNKHFDLNFLSKSLKILRFSKCFNMKLDETKLPPSLEILELGFDYNHEINTNKLPKNLKIIRFDFFGPKEDLRNIKKIKINKCTYIFNNEHVNFNYITIKIKKNVFIKFESVKYTKGYNHRQTYSNKKLNRNRMLSSKINIGYERDDEYRTYQDYDQYMHHEYIKDFTF